MESGNRSIGPHSDRWSMFHRVFSPWKPIEPYYSQPWYAYVEHLNVMRKLGYNFVTVSEVLDNKINAMSTNVILDHHIDHYPIETHAMAAWEHENGFRSSIYIFNEYIGGKGQRHRFSWKLRDLDVRFLRHLERSGFEIGYHMNALGLVRARQGDIRNYRRHVTAQEERAALRQFAIDVNSLRRYFPIRTYIPHGGGEGNAHLLRDPDMRNPPLRVYNNASYSGLRKRPIKWKNFTDSTGAYPNVLKRFGTTSVIHREPLLCNAYLMGRGVFHELTHPGRYAGGMPYGDLLDSDTESPYDKIEDPGRYPDHLTLPLDPRRAVSKPHAPPWFCDCVATTSPTREAVFSFTNVFEMIRPHLALNSRSTVGLIVNREPTDTERQAMRVPKPKSQQIPIDAESGTAAINILHNTHYAPRPLRFLSQAKFPISCLSLRIETLDEPNAKNNLMILLDRIRNDGGTASLLFDHKSRHYVPLLEEELLARGMARKKISDGLLLFRLQCV